MLIQDLSFIVYWLLDAWFFLIKPRAKQSGVVLIRLDAIGDFIIWLDTAKEFRRIYPGIKITLLANSSWSETAKNLPYWDEVWEIDTRRFILNIPYRFAILKSVRQAGFKIAIQPTYSRNFLCGDSIVRVTGAVERIGSSGDNSNIISSAKYISNRWYTRLLNAFPETMTELERNAEFIQNLTSSKFEASLPKLSFALQSKQNSSSNNDYVVLFPGASWSGKRWPIDKFSKLAETIKAEYGWDIVVCGGPPDVGLCDQLCLEVTVPVVNLSGRTNLDELVSKIQNARLLVSNDTSAIHIAAAVGTPAVCILGGGHYGRFLPYPRKMKGLKPLVAAQSMDCFNCNWRCIKPHLKGEAVPCVAGVPLELVLSLSRTAVSAAMTTNRI